MLRIVSVVAAAMLTLTMPAAAQIEPNQTPSSAELDHNLVGLPVITADSQTIGYITEVGTEDEETVAIAYVVHSSGIGGVRVSIPTRMLTIKEDHAQLSLTAELMSILDHDFDDEAGKIDSENAEFAGDLVGAPVMHLDGTQIGEVADVLFNEEGQASRLRMSGGVMLGFGERIVELPKGSFRLLRNGVVVVDLPIEAVQSLPDALDVSDEK